MLTAVPYRHVRIVSNIIRYVEKYTRNPRALRIDYIIRANCIPIWFFVVAALAAITAGIISKKWSVGLLIGYILIIMGETVIFRTHSVRQVFQPQLFWSYEVWDIQKEQIIANVLAYIPLGLMVGRLWKWKGLLAGIGLSITSELLQLITHMGLMEFDDIIHNTLGTLIGVAIYLLLEKAIKTRIND
ncbi:MAG: VanZ family protein [Clostridiales bacterium]|nr:VanZ family protein [Clostridiales bacterium]